MGIAPERALPRLTESNEVIGGWKAARPPAAASRSSCRLTMILRGKKLMGKKPIESALCANWFRSQRLEIALKRWVTHLRRSPEKPSNRCSTLLDTKAKHLMYPWQMQPQPSQPIVMRGIPHRESARLRKNASRSSISDSLCVTQPDTSPTLPMFRQGVSRPTNAIGRRLCDCVSTSSGQRASGRTY